jgi:glucose-6-phosphate dehydrogenase assembly protein OpcA
MASGEGSDPGEFLSGKRVSVDPGKIERELARLWKPAGAADATPSVTRAAVSNVIILLEDEADRARVRETVLAVGRRFPSRIFILMRGAGRTTPGGGTISATVSAVCHIVSAGAPPVCCEEITLELAPGEPEDLFGSAVLSLLVPDLPVILVSPGARPGNLLDVLDDAIDRVVLDSRLSPPSGLELAHRIFAERPGASIDDLAWRETLSWRRALCNLHDDPDARRLFHGLRSITIGYAAAGGGTAGARAALVAGWLLSRLGWRAIGERRFEKEGGVLEARLLPEADRMTGAEQGAITRVRLDSGDAGSPSFLQVSRPAAGDHLRIEHHTRDSCVLPRMVPARLETEADLVGTALERVTDQDVLRAAVEMARLLG